MRIQIEQWRHFRTPQNRGEEMTDEYPCVDLIYTNGYFDWLDVALFGVDRIYLFTVQACKFV